MNKEEFDKLTNEQKDIELKKQARRIERNNKIILELLHKLYEPDKAQEEFNRINKEIDMKIISEFLLENNDMNIEEKIDFLQRHGFSIKKVDV